jgi:TPR repeat protein
MKGRFPRWLLVYSVVIFVLAGCATPYQTDDGFLGGFSETQLAPDVFRVFFRGNGYTSGDRSQDFALLRAADLCLQHGFTCFAVLDESESTDESSYTTPGHAYTTGSAYSSGNTATYSGYTTYTPTQTHTFYKPRSGLLIRGFTTKPEGPFTFDAAFLQQSLRQKYNLATTEDSVPVWPAEATNSIRTNTFDQLLAHTRAGAENGDAAAQFKLGLYYSQGQGVPQDYVEAVKWYRKAAEQGDAGAQSMLGMIFYFGDDIAGNSVGKDYSEALKWIRKAADQGDASGEALLGEAFESGNGVQQDYGEAKKWYRKSADQGNPLGQFELGLLYANGVGVPKDYVEAYKWWNLAAAGGESKSKENLAKLERKMTPDQIAEAQRLSSEFVPHGPSAKDSSTSPDSPTATGTGFFITDDGYLISNYHVVKDAVQVRLLTGTGTISAKVLTVDTANDLALLKAEGQFSPLPIATSRTVKLGATVATVGFPDIGLQGFSPKLAKGEIAALSGAQDDPRYFQISVPVQPGNSGGALVDEHGNIIGIVSAKLDAQAALESSGALPENVNYAVKSSFLLSFLESVPDVSAKLKESNNKAVEFEDVVKSAQKAAVLVLVY